MSLREQIVSLENKRLLWQFMIENNIFDKVHHTHEKNVRSVFEDKLQQVALSLRPNDSILNVNKQIIMQMIEDVKRYTIPLQNTNNNTNNNVNNNAINNNAINNNAMLVTSEEILTKKQAQFQKGLQTKQEEFNKLIQPVKPNSIDFSDKINDEPIGSDMESRVAQAIAWREKQLSQVLEKQDTTVASDWINNGSKKINSENIQTNSPKVIKASTSTIPTSVNVTSVNVTSLGADGGNPRIMGADGGNPRNIKIGDITQIDERNIINVKKVSFLEQVEPYSALESIDYYSELDLDKSSGLDLNKSSDLDLNKSSGLDLNKSSGLDLNKSSGLNTSQSFMDKLKKKDTSNDFINLKTDFDSLNAEFVNLKTELSIITTNSNQLIETNKLLLQQQEKIIDMLDRMNFNMGTL